MVFFFKIWTNQGKINVLKFIPYFSSAPYIYIYIYIYSFLARRVFTNGPGDLGTIPGRVNPKTLKMVLDISLPNTQQHKPRIKGKSGAIQGK